MDFKKMKKIKIIIFSILSLSYQSQNQVSRGARKLNRLVRGNEKEKNEVKLKTAIGLFTGNKVTRFYKNNLHKIKTKTYSK